MKLRHIFFIFLCILSIVIFFPFVFSFNIDFQQFFYSDVVENLLIIYCLSFFVVVVTSCESEKEDGKKVIEIVYFIVAVLISLASLYVGKFKIPQNIKVSFIILFCIPFIIVIYNILYLVSEKVFNHTFKFAGNAELLFRPVDWLLTLFTCFAGFGSGIFVWSKIIGF
ncbi:hypothetical protein [Treponema sp.]|uniref:hypothetical protein n=1 Tax=Treponema sp. TaxID=166 RepID=UPI00298E43F5|nr:hypothetical protein [Treponema sp.]MCR5612402.1 hypothetical protein [Treponema sp.]